MLRPRFSFAGLSIGVFFFLLGLAGVWAGVGSVLREPTHLMAWCVAGVGVVLGGGVLALAGMGLVQGCVYRVWPSRLEMRSTHLRVRVWHTWSGPWDGLRRAYAVIPREQLRGVGILYGQGGGAQLFVAHDSGLALGMGWSGSLEEAQRLGGVVAAWIRDRPPR